MDAPLRPDLGRILPKPWLRTLAERFSPLAGREALADGDGERDGFLVEVERRPRRRADEPGFGIGQARAVALRINSWLRAPNTALPRFTPDPDRVADWLAEPRTPRR